MAGVTSALLTVDQMETNAGSTFDESLGGILFRKTAAIVVKSLMICRLPPRLWNQLPDSSR